MPFVAGKVLAQARHKKGFTQEEVSAATRPRINVSTISRIERSNRTRVRSRTLNDIARVLGVSPTELSEPQEPDRDLMRLRVDPAARNALTLVAGRYGVTREQIVEIAPFLFFLAAEKSLQARRRDLDKLREAVRAVSRSAIPHLPPKIPFDDDPHIAMEEQSIAARDLFGRDIAEGIDTDNVETAIDADDPESGGPEFDYDFDANPFHRFLDNELADIDAPASIDFRWPWQSPQYTVCEEEAAAIVGGDETATAAILWGNAALHELPKGTPFERAQWARAEDERKSRENQQSSITMLRDSDNASSGPASPSDGAVS